MNTVPDFVVALAENIGWVLLHSLWQGALVAFLLVFALCLLRRRSAAARHVASMLALLALTAVVAGTAWRVGATARIERHSSPRLSVIPSEGIAEAPREAVPAKEIAAGVEPGIQLSNGPRQMPGTDAAASQHTSWRPRFEPLLPWLSAGWIIGIVFLSLRHFAGWQRLRAMQRRSAPARHELQQSLTDLLMKFGGSASVRLLESADATVPMLAGLFKPIVLLPVRVITGLGEREIEAILAHELAHLARRDSWSNLAQLAIETLFFYHPAVWWIGRCARQERENAADDLAIEVCADRRVYAGALAQLAELRFGSQPVLAATGGSLLARIQRIVRPASVETPANGWSLGVPVLLTALAIAAIFRAQADDPKAINVSPGESIQAAIDAAPAGATIRLGAGEWKERIVISKPLTLEGAGWDKTLVRPDQPDPAYKTALAEMTARAEAVQSPKEKLKIYRDADNLGEPTITVHGTTDVVIRKIKIQGIAPGSEVKDGLHSLMLVKVESGRATISDCALTEYHCGVLVWAGGDVKIERTLVAAMWHFGVAAQKGGKVHIHESELRNCHYAGMVVGSGCEADVERSRISGAAWHGIRADDASVRLSGSTIFGNNRSGLYIDGKTHVEVHNNLFWKNGGALSAFAGECVIERNTFAENRTGDVSIGGAVKATVWGNLFADSPAAISATFKTDANSTVPSMQPTPKPNAFWRVETPIKISTWDGKTNQRTSEEKQSAPADSLAVDPKFRDAAKADFTLAADSPVRAANFGAADPLAPDGPWVLLAEEKAIIPLDDTREESFWTYPGTAKRSKVAEQAAQKSADDAKSWVADAFQLDDKAKREAAIERIRAAMTSGNADEARKGVTAFVQLGAIEFDKPSFRPAVRALLASSDVTTRAKAASAFTMTGADPEDLPRIFALADDSAAEVRDGLTYVIVQLTKYDLREKGASDAILKLMANLPRDSRSVAHAMWGVKLSPEIEAKVLDFCRDIDHASNSSVGYNFFYGSLSTQANKSEASCKRLIELLAHQDTTNIAGRSAWGLQQGVDRAQFPLVADAMVKVIEARSDGYLRNNALRCLRTYGDASHAPALKALLAKPGATGEMRKALEETLASIEGRPATNVQQSALAAASATNVPEATKPAAEKAEIEVQWKDQWWPATILKKDGERTQIHYVGYGSDWDEWVTKDRIRPLTASAATDEKARSEPARSEKLVEQNRLAARARGAEDRRHYNPEELSEIESLYQVANKNWRTEEARMSLKKLLEKYDQANRTGCATLYMGQMSEGQERIDYLTRAVEKFSDCYYFNGCQVGGYGRYVLALTLWEKGEKDKARALFNELKTKYKDATDHKGRPMGEIAEAVEKELETQN
jgi:beta-lactamase regulating signal transducer with metallopeptidase domain/nitrous oxidase accessory protein NosD